MFLRFIYAVAWISTTFLFKAKSCSIVRIYTVYPFILMDTWAISTFWLLRIMLHPTLAHMFESLFSLLQGIYTEVEVLGQPVILFLTF